MTDNGAVAAVGEAAFQKRSSGGQKGYLGDNLASNQDETPEKKRSRKRFLYGCKKKSLYGEEREERVPLSYNSSMDTQQGIVKGLKEKGREKKD